jgi:hypothetical protein
MNAKLIIVGILFSVIFISGFVLRGMARPYSSGALNLHKLLGLAALVFFVVTVCQIARTSSASASTIAAAVLTVLVFLGLIVTGGLVSALPAPPKLASAVHKIFPYLTVLSSGVTLYFLA